MVEMEKSRRFKGVVIKPEPQEMDSTSTDSFEEMKMNDNGHVSDDQEMADEYSEMTYDDMGDFEPVKHIVKGEPTCEIVIDQGIAGFAAECNLKKGTISNLANYKVNGPIDVFATNVNKTEMCQMNQIDDILFKAMDQISKFNPCDDETVTEKQCFQNESSQGTDEMLSEDKVCEALTDFQNLLLPEANREHRVKGDRNLTGENLLAVEKESSKSLHGMHPKHSDCSDMNSKCCSKSGQNLADENNLYATKTESNMGKTLDDKQPMNGCDSNSENCSEGGRNVPCHEINLYALKREKDADNNIFKDSHHPKQTESADVTRTSTKEEQTADRENMIILSNSSESSDLDNKHDKSLPIESEKADSKTSQKRRRRRTLRPHRSRPYFLFSDRQHTNDSISSMQFLCDSFGEPSASYLYAKHRLMNRKLISENGFNGNVMPQGKAGNTSTLNQSRYGYQASSYNNPNSVNQSYGVHVPYRASNISCENSSLNNTQNQQANFQTPCNGNNSQGPTNQTSPCQAQIFHNNRSCVNSSQTMTQPSDFDFQQSLNNFDIDLLGFTQAAPSRNFNSDTQSICGDGTNLSGCYNISGHLQNNVPSMHGAVKSSLYPSAIHRQPRDIINSLRNVNNDSTDMCHHSTNQHPCSANPIQTYPTNLCHSHPANPVQTSPADLHQSYPANHGQITSEFCNTTVNPNITYPQPTGTVHYAGNIIRVLGDAGFSVPGRLNWTPDA